MTMVTILIGAALSVLACWGLARAGRGRVHDCCIIPIHLKELLGSVEDQRRWLDAYRGEENAH